MFYLTTHSTLYLRLYGVRHMVKDHSDSEKGNPLPPHRLLLSINSKGSFICISHTQDNTYHSLCYTSRIYILTVTINGKKVVIIKVNFWKCTHDLIFHIFNIVFNIYFAHIYLFRLNDDLTECEMSSGSGTVSTDSALTSDTGCTANRKRSTTLTSGHPNCMLRLQSLTLRNLR